jgi:D-aspartate ligase
MKKVYTAHTQDEAVSIVNAIFGSGYDDAIIIQDFIPGDDSNMRVLSMYSDKNNMVKMACLGRVLLEEHTPKGLGNHAAIITEHMPSLSDGFARMLNDVGYRGFSNFDIKYDIRDNTMRAFEINLRQGRSNYYITASGINIASLLINDYILNNELVYTEAGGEYLWHSIPRGVIYRYVRDKTLTDKVKQLVRDGHSASSFWYSYDLRFNPLRFIFVIENARRQYGKYKKYCK